MPAPKNSLKTKTLRSMFWTTGAKGVSQGLTLVTTIVLAQFITVNDFGLMAMAVVYMGLVDNIIDFGFLSAIIQRKEINSVILSSCFWFLAGASLLFWLLTYILAPGIASLFGEQQLAPIIGVLSIVFLFVPSQIISRGILSRKLRLDIIAKAELFTSILRSSVAIVLALNGFGVWSLIYGYVIEKITLAAILPFLARWFPRFIYDNKSVRSLLVFGGKVTGSRILWYLYSKVDFFIVGRLLGTEILGLYSIASQFAKALFQFSSMTFHRVIYPVFSRKQDDPEQLQRIFLKASILLTTATWPIFFGLTAIAPDLIYLLLGEKWLGAIVPLQILSVVAAMQITISLVPQLINALGRPGINIYINLFSFILMCAGFLLGVQLWGLNGLLVAWLIIVPIQYVVILYVVAPIIRLPVNVYLQQHIRTVSSSLIMFILVYSVYYLAAAWRPELRMSMCIIVGVVSYVILQLLLCRDTFKELQCMVKDTVKVSI